MPRSRDKIIYKEFTDINQLQRDIMKFIQKWVIEQKTPVPHSIIIQEMKKNGNKSFTVYSAILSLLQKRYIRRAIMTSNKTYYVQLRSV